MECVILIGVPGAGKTTFFERYLAATHLHISNDLWPHARSRSVRSQRALNDALTQGQSAAIDNTNPSSRDRAPLISVARTHGARVVGYFFNVTTSEAAARNGQRTGRRRVPNAAIFAAAKRLQPPDFVEGFDRLFQVSPTPGGGFRIEEVKRPD